MKNLQELFEHELKDIYSAEKQLTEALPKMRDAATHEKLKQGFADHLEQTKKQMERVRTILDEIDVNPGNTKCDAMEGLIEEGEGIIKEEAPGNVKDAALIAAAQRVEHYEISAYGTAVEYAKTLGHDKYAEVLKEILEEEAQCNEHLNDLAISEINKSAM
ncbi:MAG: ferritin-like domain-containing protein [Weeksellaceae bacterium]